MPTFRFGLRKSGAIGHVPPEQQAILDKLNAGEITPEEAAKQLGGKAHVFEWSTGPKPESEGDEESDPPRPATAEPRPPTSNVIVVPIPWARMLLTLAAAFTLVLGLFVAFADRSAQNHAFVALLVAVGSLILFGGLAAGPGVGVRPARGSGLTVAPLLGAAAVLDWGLLAAVTHHWSAYFPGLIWVGITVAVAICLLLVRVLVRRTRDTFDLLERRKDR